MSGKCRHRGWHRLRSSSDVGTAARNVSLSFLLALLIHVGPVHAAPTGPPSVSSEQELAEARRWLQLGAQEYDEQHWEAARDAFLKAWTLRQHYAVAANLAATEMQLGRYREAAEHWSFSLANLPAERVDARSEAQQQLVECTSHLETVSIRVNIEGAAVRLDGQVVGKSPITGSLLVDPGQHTVDAELQGYSKAARDFVSVAGNSRSVDVVLDQTPSASDTTPTGAPAPTASRPSSAVPLRTWVLIGEGTLSLAALGIGIGYGLSADAAWDDAARIRAPLKDGACDPKQASVPISCGELAQKVHDHDTFARVAVDAFVTAGVLGAATIATYLLWPTHTKTGERVGLTVSPWTFVGGRGIQAMGQF